MFGKFNVGTVSHVVDGGGELLQRFPDDLDLSFQLIVERCFQFVVTVAILKCLCNFVVRLSSRDCM
jgi:hypothetical protein